MNQADPRPQPWRSFAHMLMLLGVGSGSVPAFAQAVAMGGGQVYGLTDLQKAQVREANAQASAGATSGQLPDGGPDRQIHGEIGAMIGSGGARSVGGTAAIPLGQNGGAIISFESSRFGDRRSGWR